MTSSQTPLNAYKVSFLCNYHNHRRGGVKTVLAATPDEARAEFNRNINQELDPVITCILPVYFHHDSGRYMTVPEAGPQEPPDDYRIFNKRQPDGTYRPLSEFFDREVTA